jgi:hypothetical protein
MFAFRPGEVKWVTEKKAPELLKNPSLVIANAAQYAETEVVGLDRLNREQLLIVARDLMRGKRVDVAAMVASAPTAGAAAGTEPKAKTEAPGTPARK